LRRRRLGQLAAAVLALLCFGLALWAARSSSIPELRVYDGYMMVAGATLLVSLTAPVVWRWPRERSLVAIALASTLGCVMPLVISALLHHIPLIARLRGAWVLGGADLVGPPMIIGFVCLWFALREYGAERADGTRVLVK
jgi:hypothetical protein